MVTGSPPSADPDVGDPADCESPPPAVLPPAVSPPAVLPPAELPESGAAEPPPQAAASSATLAVSATTIAPRILRVMTDLPVLVGDGRRVQ
jgi:hypothetical protein